MRKALILISLIMTLFSPLYADIDCTGMPEKELENKDVVVYCWSEFVPEKGTPKQVPSLVDLLFDISVRIPDRL